ncbi:MAG: UDP-N-acetylmuramoyl-L-alanyl-D-glutamate--2,6-diaminopimelate ligase [Planctomycetota bacterium]|jgi:UDP-N-acetylmuramoyl-L-alanyl-D-glutamate--2,6-diaminopimelate ligase
MDSVGKGMEWSGLLKGAGICLRWEGSADPIITSVVEDSRQAGPGSCFVARSGLQVDGHDYVDGALQAGASAVVTERPVSLPDSVARLCVGNAHGVAGRLASVLYGLDDLQRTGQLKVVGITGTNGKSTFCFLLQAILRSANHPSALLGTIEYDLLSRKLSAPMTTPPAATLMSYLAEAVHAGATHAVIEASSHALDQGRCAGVDFSVGVFSNLTGDHQDYHENMDLYKQAKKRLFDGLGSEAAAIINIDDREAEGILADCCAGRVIRYSLQEGGSEFSSHLPDVFVRGAECSMSGTGFELSVRGESFGFSGSGIESVGVNSSLIGRHNIMNCLAAASAALSLGVGLDVIAGGLASVDCIPGRLERVMPGGDHGFSVLVDYAHTDDALKNVLSSLRDLFSGRLIVMFGCGGDRDRSKRPRMAEAAGKFADLIVVTSDNPRTEDPQRIIDDILAGFSGAERSKVRVEPDRRRAIGEAIGLAGPSDVVLLAGKGHEKYQEINGERIPFDDVAAAGEILGEYRASNKTSPLNKGG